MKKALFAMLVTLVVSILFATVYVDFGILAAILMMGGFIIYFNDKK